MYSSNCSLEFQTSLREISFTRRSSSSSASRSPLALGKQWYAVNQFWFCKPNSKHVMSEHYHTANLCCDFSFHCRDILTYCHCSKGFMIFVIWTLGRLLCSDIIQFYCAYLICDIFYENYNTFTHAEFKSEEFPLRRPAVFSQTAILFSLISRQIFSTTRLDEDTWVCHSKGPISVNWSSL